MTLIQPCTPQLSADFAAARSWAENRQSTDSRIFQIAWRDINHHQLGRNQLLAAMLETAKTAAACREAER
ncbi:DUF3322 domain-containing protein [Methylomonas montana]|uniref:DUF3322 domain-containing protein n=1 Tax=Methylomonas montana TaxID=3058963 RepID=UPI002659C2B2|nr:DUF3322 domain-containing protein [Methylomonas montana]WKJ91579.1 DUF3322 domain-containing protein [Methylomonas montana]